MSQLCTTFSIAVPGYVSVVVRIASGLIWLGVPLDGDAIAEWGARRAKIEAA